MTVDIVCIHCMAAGSSSPEIAIEEDDTLARCNRCGRRYRIFTGDLARSAEGRHIDAVRASYVLNLAPSERLPQRWRITAPSNCKFERGYRYTLTWHHGRLVGIADQTSGEWIRVPHAWTDDAGWRAAWVAIILVIIANLILQWQALGKILDRGGLYWAGPVVIGLIIAALSIRWLFTAERERS